MEKVHAAYAPEDLRKRFGQEMGRLRAAAPRDDLGRIDERAVSRQLAKWWQDHGYTYP